MDSFEGQNKNAYSNNAEPPKIRLMDFAEIFSMLSGQQREDIIADYSMNKFVKIFKDSGMMQTINVFLESGMNISRTAKILYMHRNTLIYKLNAIRKSTGLDLRDFHMAATFKMLHALYVLNK